MFKKKHSKYKIAISQPPVISMKMIILSSITYSFHFQKVEEFFTDCEITLKELEDLHQYVEKSRTLRPSQVEDAINTSSDMAESTKMLVYNATETGNGV